MRKGICIMSGFPGVELKAAIEASGISVKTIEPSEEEIYQNNMEYNMYAPHMEINAREIIEVFKPSCSICNNRDANRMLRGKGVCTVCKPLHIRR